MSDHVRLGWRVIYKDYLAWTTHCLPTRSNRLFISQCMSSVIFSGLRIALVAAVILNMICSHGSAFHSVHAGICMNALRRLPRYFTVVSGDLDVSGGAQQLIPNSFKSPFMNTMLQRGFIFQCTDFQSLDSKLSAGAPVSAYLGFDATAKSLHVGSLLQIMILRHLQRHGHKPIVLVGGGTTKVGDPTGKDESRKLLTTETIQENIDSLSRVFAKFIKFGDGATDATLVNNADWLDNLNYLEFLRDYGRLFTINRMLTYESVKQRLTREQPLTFLEFNYMLLQAYDFVELHRRFDVALQLGGSDQWGNIVSGVELGRKLGLGQLYGMTAPLMTTSDGKKMGKTANGAVWLNKDLLSEYDYWQFWRNTADADVIKFLKLFTELPLEQIAEYEKLEGASLNDVKAVLANEATALLHGPECLQSIHSTVQSLFTGSGSDERTLESLPRYSLQSQSVSQGAVTVVDLLVQAQMSSSRNEARRLIRAGGVRINDVKVDDEQALVSVQDFEQLQNRLKLSQGKKKHVLFVLEESNLQNS